MICICSITSHFSPVVLICLLHDEYNSVASSLFTQTTTCKHVRDKNSLFKQALLFCSLLWVGSGWGWQQIVCVQWIAAQESINRGLCKWTEQGRNQLQSPAKSCLLTHLLKHAGKLTALDFNGMNLKWQRLETVKKHGPAFLEEKDNCERDVETRYRDPDFGNLMKCTPRHGLLR